MAPPPSLLERHELRCHPLPARQVATALFSLGALQCVPLLTFSAFGVGQELA